HQGPSYLLALNAATGKILWKKDRNLEAREEGNDSYSTPIVVEVNGHDQIVLSGAEHLNAYDPITGKEIWRVGDLQVPHPYGRTIAGPTAGEGKVITVASGFRNQGFLVGVTPAHEGDSAVIDHDWKQKRYSPDCPTPVIYGGKVFTIRDDGMASCIDIKTGNAHWQERLFAENVKVSPVAANGYIYFTTGRANTKVLKASETFEIVATNELNEETLSTPALSSGNIIIRTFESLYCIR
ncbi:MAG: PQQ-binding-like beta-propeller repeat protein, partial [Verrucomicrobia bacterium]|nr:PQQ-binding-like beta-propeller repeat protein [Verrucomicrobiota bacterium]